MELADLKRQASQAKQKLEEQKASILKKANESARDILRKAKAEADESIPVSYTHLDVYKRQPKDYPHCRIVRLTVNYRCREIIVKAAGSLIAHNAERFEKTISANRRGGAGCV